MARGRNAIAEALMAQAGFENPGSAAVPYSEFFGGIQGGGVPVGQQATYGERTGQRIEDLAPAGTYEGSAQPGVTPEQSMFGPPGSIPTGSFPETQSSEPAPSEPAPSEPAPSEPAPSQEPSPAPQEQQQQAQPSETEQSFFGEFPGDPYGLGEEFLQQAYANAGLTQGWGSSTGVNRKDARKHL